MKYKHTKCKFCGTQEGPIFMMPKPATKDDCWCEECRNKEIEKLVKNSEVKG